MPNRTTCDYFYGVFIYCVHPITPFFHLPTFNGRYHRFWEWYGHWGCISIPQGVLAEVPSFLPLLLAVLYYGSVIEPLIAVTKCETDVDLSLFLTLGPCALGMVDFPNKTAIYSLAAFILLQMDQLRCQYTSACSFVAAAVRIAQSMGLHKEEANDGVDTILAEERRRIWCLLMHIDMATARTAGLAPLLTHQLSGRFSFLSELRDKFVGIRFSGDPRHINPSFILARGRYEASLYIKPLLVRQADQNPVTLADVWTFKQSLRLLQANLEERITRIRKMDISQNLLFTAAGTTTISQHILAEMQYS